MPLSLSQLTTPLTPDEVKTSIYGVLAALGVPTASWRPGAVVRTIVASCAIVVAALSELTALVAKSGFLELAEDDWLTIHAHQVFGVDRIEATFATGFVTLTNTAGGVFDFAPGDVVFRNTAAGPGFGKTYRTTESFTLIALQTKSVAIQATEAGSSSTANPGEINAFETPLLGVTVSNANSVVGLDGESDEALRTRCLEARGFLSPNGPREAYEFAAKTAQRANGQVIGVVRVGVSKSSTTGQVTVTVGDASGTLGGDPDDPSTDLGAVKKLLDDKVVPDCITLTVRSASPVSVPVTYEVWLNQSAGLADSEVQARILAKLTSFFEAQPIGGHVIDSTSGKLFVNSIASAIGSVLPEIFQVLVTSPPANVVLGETEVAVLGSPVSSTIHQVAAEVA